MSALATDGRRVMVGLDGGGLWESRPGQPDVLSDRWERVTALALGHRDVAALIDGRVCWHTVGSGAGDQWLRLGDRARHVAVSPDGKWVVTAVPDVRVWEAGTGRLVRVLEVGPDFDGVTFDPAGRWLAVSSWREVQLWDATRWVPVGPGLRIPDWGVRALAAATPDAAMGIRGRVLAVTDRSVLAWPVPEPLEGSAERITLWAQVLSGHELDTDGQFRGLDAATLEARKARLQELGGPPRLGPLPGVRPHAAPPPIDPFRPAPPKDMPKRGPEDFPAPPKDMPKADRPAPPGASEDVGPRAYTLLLSSRRFLGVTGTYDQDKGGLLVISVDRNGPASRMSRVDNVKITGQLERGDVIVRIEGTRVESFEHFRMLLNSAPDPQKVRILVWDKQTRANITWVANITDGPPGK